MLSKSLCFAVFHSTKLILSKSLKSVPFPSLSSSFCISRARAETKAFSEWVEEGEEERDALPLFSSFFARDLSPPSNDLVRRLKEIFLPPSFLLGTARHGALAGWLRKTQGRLKERRKKEDENTKLKAALQTKEEHRLLIPFVASIFARRRDCSDRSFVGPSDE